MQTETRYYTEFKAMDSQGEYSVQVQNDGSQLRFSTEDGLNQIFFDTNKSELIAIRDCIDKVVSKLH